MSDIAIIELEPNCTLARRQGLIECLNALSPTPSLTNEELLAILQRRHERRLCTLLALEDERVVGTASYFFELKILRGGVWAGHIEDVAVHPNHQGKGIGRRLIRYIVSLCQVLGCYKVVLSCSEKNRPFYEKLGFRQSGLEMRVDFVST